MEHTPPTGLSHLTDPSQSGKSSTLSAYRDRALNWSPCPRNAQRPVEIAGQSQQAHGARGRRQLEGDDGGERDDREIVKAGERPIERRRRRSAPIVLPAAAIRSPPAP